MLAAKKLKSNRVFDNNRINNAVLEYKKNYLLYVADCWYAYTTTINT